MEKSTVHGNNHAGKTTMTIWLAGLTDGDGCIGIHKQKVGKKTTYVPDFSISTTCRLTHDYLNVVFNALQIGRYWTFRISKKRNWKDRWNLTVRGMKRNKPLLEMLIPYLITKKQEAILTLDFINERLSYPYRKGYTSKQLEIINNIYKIKDSRNGSNCRIPTDYTCDPILEGEDIVGR